MSPCLDSFISLWRQRCFKVPIILIPYTNDKGKRYKLLVKLCLILVYSNITKSEPRFVSNTRPGSSFAAIFIWLEIIQSVPDNKVHGANMGPIWVLSAPDVPHVGPMKLVIKGSMCVVCRDAPVCIKRFVHRKNFSPWLLLSCNTDMLSIRKTSWQIKRQLSV